MAKLIVGIDVAKDYSTAQGLDEKRKKLFNLRFSMDFRGFSLLLNTIKAHSCDMGEVMAGMESTGCYHINLFSFLCSEGVSCIVINPLLIANFGRLSCARQKQTRRML